MKIKVQFKEPDALNIAVNDNYKLNELEKVVHKFVECGEYITVEVDTESRTVTVTTMNIVKKDQLPEERKVAWRL